MPGVEGKDQLPISLTALEGKLTGEYHDGGLSKKKAMTTTDKVLFVATFPFVFFLLPILKYVIPCILLTLHKIFIGGPFHLVRWCLGKQNCCTKVEVMACEDCMMYRDSSFFGDDAIGNKDAETAQWRRATHVCGEDQSMYLFGSDIDAADVAQGALGDCWLLSAIACLAEFPGAVQSVFITRERSYRGAYTVKLWSNFESKWRHITVDDRIPCRAGGGPIYCHTAGTHTKMTIWSLILEKAFAKYCNSYQNLSGGSVLWALQAMTGDKVITYDRRESSGKWEASTIRPGTGTKEQPRSVRWSGVDGAVDLDDAAFFAQLVELDRRKAVMGAGTKHRPDDVGRQDTKDKANHGIVAGHAYTIKACVEVCSKGETFQLLQLRNPWGSFEWDGAWSDRSPLWDEHPAVAKACKRVGTVAVADDGLFWMTMRDFSRYYAHVDVCYRKVGAGDLAMNVYEGKGVEGTCVGCMEGVAYWYCCCGGVDALCCPVDYKDSEIGKEVEVHKGMCAPCTRKADDCILMKTEV